MFKTSDASSIPMISIDDDDDEVMVVDTVGPLALPVSRKGQEPSSSAASVNPVPSASAATSTAGVSKQAKIPKGPSAAKITAATGKPSPPKKAKLTHNTAAAPVPVKAAKNPVSQPAPVVFPPALSMPFPLPSFPKASLANPVGSLVATLDPTEMASGSGMSAGNWDPLKSGDWDRQTPFPSCQKRMTRDLQAALQEEKDTLIFMEPDEANITKFSALIVGPKDTPYEGGYFLFAGRVPADYPLHSPRIRNMTTANGMMRFGPNLYADGKVCLSILGTWAGPSWTAAYNLLTTLQSIQTLMSVGALRNEPGFAAWKENQKEVVNYDRFIQHETIRIAILGNLQIALDSTKKTFTKKFRTEMFCYFLDNCGRLLEVCNNNSNLDGSAMYCWGSSAAGNFAFGKLKSQLMEYRATVEAAFNDLRTNEAR